MSNYQCTVQFDNSDMLEQTQEKKCIAVLVLTYCVQIFEMSNGFLNVYLFKLTTV